MKFPPLLLIHGYPLDHTMWYGVIAAMGSGIRSIAPDLPGFGKAPPLESPPAIERYAEEMLRLLDNEQIDTAVVAGMSMGGYVALAMAEIAPRRISGLALINSQCYADSDEARKARGEMIKKIRAEGPLVAARAILPKLFSAAKAENPDMQQFATDGAIAAGTPGLTWALEAMARRPDRSKILAEAEFPVAILHSAEDAIIPREKAEQMAALNPAIHKGILKSGGHAAAIENPDEVASKLRNFIELCPKVAEKPKDDDTTTIIRRPPAALPPTSA